jgi:MFS transporter, MHS family, shikimate and dehydroshikimate transport protein
MERPIPETTASAISPGTVALASAVGTTIEWYDFFLYGVVTPLVLNKLFFPNFDAVVGTLLAYTTFFVGFISRPIGGIIFGHYGDRIGRKTVLILTLIIMGTATFLIGLLPTYSSIGIWAPILLLLLRIFQGIGIGGEWGGAVLMAVEHSPAGRRGFYGSWPQIGVPAGLLLSAGAVYVLSYLSDADFLAWGWRIAFLISAVLVAVGLYIRLKVMETPAFNRIQQEDKIAAVPVVDLFKTHGKNTLLGLGARYIEGVTFNTFGVFIVGYLTGVLHLSRQTALAGVMISSAIMIIMLPIYGNLSDRYGPQAALFSELFDTRVRYTGTSFVYQFSGIFASGLTPIIATALLPLDDNKPWLICLYVLAVSIVSALSVYAMTESNKRDMAVDNKLPKPA